MGHNCTDGFVRDPTEPIYNSSDSKFTCLLCLYFLSLRLKLVTLENLGTLFTMIFLGIACFSVII